MAALSPSAFVPLPPADERTLRKPVPPLTEGPLALPHSLRGRRNFAHGMLDELKSFVASVLECDVEDLPRLHELPEGLRALGGSGSFRHDPFCKRWTSRLGSDAELRSRLDDLTRRFVSDASAAFDEYAAGGFVYQRVPSLRVHMPGARPLGVPHKDADYFHQPGEVNLWVPLTRCAGTNSLYCESRPGAADYSPFEVEPGEACRFWGNQCMHFTLPNETPTTRVSLDVRVVPMALHVDDWASPKGRVAFQLGGYYASLDEATVPGPG